MMTHVFPPAAGARKAFIACGLLRASALAAMLLLPVGTARALPAIERHAFPSATVLTRPEAIGARSQATMELIVAATTDVHGWVQGWDYYTGRADTTRGLARIATIVDSIRAANPSRVLLVDAGDFLQGNPLNYVAAKVAARTAHPVIAAMNAMRYDFVAPGNHEFDYGVPFLEKMQLAAKFPLSSANVRTASGAAHMGTFRMIERNGARVAIIGGTTTAAMSGNGDLLRAKRIKVTDVVPDLRSAVQSAKTAGANAIIVVLHSGLTPVASSSPTADASAENVADVVARDIPGIDLIVFGHTHLEVVDSTINGVMLMQPRQWATSLGVAKLTLLKENGQWRVTGKRGASVAAVGHRESPAILAATETGHRAAVRWVQQPVGRTVARWRGDSARVQDSPIVDFVGEVMRRESKADLAATAAFSLTTKLDSGAIPMARLAEMYPYDNTLRAVRISGRTLRAFLEHSARYYRSLNADGSAPQGGIVNEGVPGYNFDIVVGADYDIDLRKPLGQRIVNLAFRGKPVADTDTFTMATNNYRQGGGGGYAMLRDLPVTYAKNVEIRQLLIDEVKRVGTIRAENYFKQNWKLVPSSVVAMAYAQQNATPAAAPQATGTSAQPGRTLRVITTSDFHAALEGRRDERGRVRGGAVALQSALAAARRECTAQCTSITVDAGDLFSGSPASDWAGGKPTVAAINRMGISAGALGNHEFDFGQDTLRTRLRELNYRVLAANVFGTDGKTPTWLKSDTIVVRDGLRIGVVGAASQFTPGNTKRRFIQGLRFEDPAPLVSARVKALRAQNVDAVIVTIHDGARCTVGLSDGCEGSGIEFVKRLTEKPDAVVLGHAHTNIVLTINGIPSVQVSSNGRGIGVIDIPLGVRASAKPTVRDVIGDSLAIDPVLDTIVKNAVQRVAARREQPVATIKESLQRDGEQYPLGNLIADAMRVMGNGDFGAWNNGGIRTDLRAGPINFGGVHELTPFNNYLAKITMRGRNLRTFLETLVRGRNPDAHVSGMTIDFDGNRPVGQKMMSIKTADGRELVDDKVYTIITNDYMLDELQGSRPELMMSFEVLPIVDAPAIAEYLKRLPQPVVAPPEVRIRQVGGSR